jgi:hypothetical protein
MLINIPYAKVGLRHAHERSELSERAVPLGDCLHRNGADFGRHRPHRICASAPSRILNGLGSSRIIALDRRQCAGPLTYFGAVARTPLSEQPRHNQHQGPDGHDGKSEKQIPFAYHQPAKSGTHLLSPMLTSPDCK